MKPDPSRASVDCDVLVVGGGINGCGVARDLAGRGWRVVLCEKDDLASHTSSASTKLIHGGLRYLEQFEFALVRKALQEREVLLASAPHLMWPLRFVVPLAPDDSATRSPWLIRIGLFLYDHLARRAVLPASRTIDLANDAAGAPLQPRHRRAFEYSDGWVDDARLVVACALDARDRGARVLVRTRCTRIERGKVGWTATLDGPAGTSTIGARAVVNAAGPWADRFLDGVDPGARRAARTLRLVRGSHVVVPKLYEHDRAYLLQGPDRRVVFAIPYERDFTLLGTTDIELDGPMPDRVVASADEIAYLCDEASRWFARPLRPADVVWSYAGVRPLLDDASGDPSAVTRDYRIDESGIDANASPAPLVSILGGKITTFRRLAEETGDAIGRLLGESRPAWTRGAALAGGDLSAWLPPSSHRLPPDRRFARFVDAVRARWPWLPCALAERLARAYGSRIDRVIGDARGLIDFGREVAPGLFERELRYLRDDEWATSGDDVLWRRSKLGLHLDAAEREAVGSWMR